MNLENFTKHIKTVDAGTLDEYESELRAKLKRARAPEWRLGYEIALERIHIERKMREPLSPEVASLSDDQLFEELFGGSADTTA